jgi:hypothetical protein
VADNEQLSLFEPETHGGVGLVESEAGGTQGNQSDPGSEALTAHLNAKALALEVVLNKYDLVDANERDGYMIVAERRTNQAFPILAEPDQSTRELGSASPSPWTSWTREEHVSALRDLQGLTTFYRMKRGDGIVRGSLRALKTPLLSGHWYIKPASTETRDVNIAKFVQKNIFHLLNVSFPVLLHDILLCAEYGYMPFEIVWNAPELVGGKFVQYIRKVAPRHPMDVREWLYDKQGGPNGIVMEPATGNPMEPGIFIPIEKLAVFTPEPEAGDLAGVSVLRSAYKHWYYKETMYKIDAIQKERHGIGIPVIKLPIGYSPEDKKVAQELGRNLRTNEKAHIVLPNNWEFMFAKIEGQHVDCLKSIDHHDAAIMANVLGSWIKEANAKEESLDMFMKSTRYVAAVITDIFNRFIIKKLVYANFTLGPDRECPQLVCRRIGEWNDLRTQSFTVRNLVGAGVIEPDDDLEDAFRDELDMPPKDAATARKMITEPNPEPDPTDPEANDPPTQASLKNRGQKAGMPRQQPTPPVNAGRSNTGVSRK